MRGAVGAEGTNGGRSAIRQARAVSRRGIGIVAGIGEFFLENPLPAGVFGAAAAGAAADASESLKRAGRFWVGYGWSPITRAPHRLSNAGQQSLNRLRFTKLHGYLIPVSTLYRI